MTEDSELVYLAGFFDGEGSIGVFKGSLTVRVVNSYRPTLDLFLARFGGAVRVHRHGDERARMTWVWRVNGAAAEAALREMLPYLREKSSQAGCGVLYRTTPKGPLRDTLISSLALLKRTTHQR